MLWTCCGFAVGGIMTHFFYKMADFDDDMLLACSSLECESKKFTPPPDVFWKFSQTAENFL